MTLLRLVNRTLPKKNNVWALHTFPDFDSTTRAFVDYARANTKLVLQIAVNGAGVVPEWAKVSNVHVVKKSSLRGLVTFLRCSAVFFTHGYFIPIRPVPGQLVVNVWHGMPLKKIGRAAGREPSHIPSSNMLVATSPVYGEVMTEAFEGKFDSLMISGLPYYKLLLADNSSAEWRHDLFGSKKIITCLPTYRKSVVGDIRTDGDEQGLFTENGKIDWTLLNEWLTQNDSIFILKPHPMAPPVSVDHQGKVLVINEAWLSNNGLTLYDLLSVTDVLVTDMSSVAVDFLITDRPMVFAMNDFEVYSATRGLNFGGLNSEDLPGAVTSDIEGLVSALQRIEDGDDEAQEVRQTWRNRCHGQGQLDFFDQLTTMARSTEVT